MPRLEGYVATVTVDVKLETVDGKPITSYAVTREARGSSHPDKASTHIANATAAAVASSRGMAAAVDNTEARRLK